jgi:hypothetical protein
VTGTNSGIGIHSPFGYHINGTGGPVFAIEFGIFTPQALFALVLFIFGTAVGRLSCAVSFTGAHVVSLLDLPVVDYWEKMGQDVELSILILTEMSGYVMKNQFEDLTAVIFNPRSPLHGNS